MLHLVQVFSLLGLQRSARTFGEGSVWAVYTNVS